MKKILILLAASLTASCGVEEKRNLRTNGVDYSDYKVVGQAIIKVSSVNNFSLVENITYPSASVNTLTIDNSNLATSPIETEANLDLGSLSISNLKVNNLNQCGGGSDKCTSAIVRIYTTDVAGSEGIAGFVNITNGYGADVTVGESGGLSGTAGLLDGNAAIVDQYTIPASDRKLMHSDFSGTTYDVNVDFSNAGAGDYEMNLVIEVAVN